MQEYEYFEAKSKQSIIFQAENYVAQNVEVKPTTVKDRNLDFSTRKMKVVQTDNETQTKSNANSNVASNYKSTNFNMMKMVVMLVKSFRKMTYIKFRNGTTS